MSNLLCPSSFSLLRSFFFFFFRITCFTAWGVLERGEFPKLASLMFHAFKSSQSFFPSPLLPQRLVLWASCLFLSSQNSSAANSALFFPRPTSPLQFKATNPPYIKCFPPTSQQVKRTKPQSVKKFIPISQITGDMYKEVLIKDLLEDSRQWQNQENMPRKVKLF